MNKIKLIPLALAAFMFSACSSEDTENGGGGNNNVDVSYLSVNIQNVGEAMSRAEGDVYEDGTPNESNINNVRFYFFNADGSPYLLQKNDPKDTDKNWMTVDKPTDGTKNDEKPNVTKLTEAILVINGENKVAPHSVVAVINSTSLSNNLDSKLGNGALSLSDLRNVQDTLFYDAKETKNFVMANSIYMTKDGKEEYAVPVSGHVAIDPEVAKTNPIDIYVERVAAKVTTTCDTKKGWNIGTETWNNGKWTYQLKDKIFNNNVFVVVDGWSVADANRRANVEKVISTTWDKDLLGIDPWTTGDYHRCFWETSVPFEGDNKVLNKSFKNISSAIADGVVYTQPNTPVKTGDFADKMENSLTKVIVAAHLWYKDEAGVAHRAEICKYKGIQYLSKEDVLTVVANENKSKYFKKTTTTDSEGHNVDVYTSISKDDLTFATSAPEGGSATLKDYEVIPQFKSDAEIYDADHKSVNVADANKALAIDANKAQVRREGRVYYYTPIQHLGTEEAKLGYYGVVRNHSYKINIQDVSGFGTPVYNPDKVIDPTLPEEENIYLAARIKVLSWRVVNSNVNLDSNKKK
ncbi:Mfa1 family fimbria major subunit [Prevotella sp. 885]|uniref:Mfa1 family fimbria major subunit n=1 Tax=Prevotella sp. 885 TaxID=2022527 RepID=UPI000BA05C93|nr:Mfa1 family fimbria major subunit [Prevotella sp. 885]OZT03793.1 hypothetical protein CHL74_08505 [Prevotella sp. 885]